MTESTDTRFASQKVERYLPLLDHGSAQLIENTGALVIVEGRRNGRFILSLWRANSNDFVATGRNPGEAP